MKEIFTSTTPLLCVIAIIYFVFVLLDEVERVIVLNDKSGEKYHLYIWDQSHI